MGPLWNPPFPEIARDNKFVMLVVRYQRGETSVDEVIDLLREYERKHDVEVIAPGLPYEVDESVPRLFVQGDPRFEHLQDPTDEILDQLCIESYYPFLTDTWAVLHAAFPDDADIVFRNTYFYHATARGYGGTYAEWANKTQWLGRQKWKYVDFYYAQSFSEEFYQWLQTLYEIVVKKTARRPDA